MLNNLVRRCSAPQTFASGGINKYMSGSAFSLPSVVVLGEGSGWEMLRIKDAVL